MPPGFLLSRYPIGPVASPRCVARSSYYFWEIRGSLCCVIPTPNILGFAAHLTQARAIFRPVRPSGRSPYNAAIYAYIPSPPSLRVPSREQTQSCRLITQICNTHSSPFQVGIQASPDASLGSFYVGITAHPGPLLHRCFGSKNPAGFCPYCHMRTVSQIS
jgi:hypothetical protein